MCLDLKLDCPKLPGRAGVAGGCGGGGGGGAGGYTLCSFTKLSD